MVSRSATSRRGLAPWQGLLLAASLLTFWNPPTTAQMTIDSVPSDAAEGGDVLLLVYNLPANNIAYNWYKGGTVASNNQIGAYLVPNKNTTEGPAYSHRETIYPNGSLLVRNVILGDSGVYTLQVVLFNFLTEIASGQFRVHLALPKPSITINNSNPVEGKDSVVLTCEPETQNTTYQWWINGQRLQDGNRLNLSDDGRGLTLFNVTRNDTGPYECETRNLVSGNRSDPVTLNISYGPDAPIITPTASYFILGTNLNLSCHATSNPPAQYSWFFNGNHLPSTQELSLPRIAANDSGSYTCSVHNPTTGLSRTTTKNITVIEPVSPPSIQATNTTVAEEDSVVLTCLTGGTGVSIQWVRNDQPLQLTDRMTLSLNSSVLTIDPVRREDAGQYQCEVFNPVSSRRSSIIRLEVKYPVREDSDLSGGAIAGIVVAVVAGVALIGALAYFLFFRKIGRASDQHDLTEHKPSVSSHSLGPSDNSPNKVDEIAYSSLNFSALQPKPLTSDSPSPTITETVYSEVKKK